MHSNCPLCHAPGETLYRDLRDRLYSAPGQWTLLRCPNSDCGLAWLDPMPSESDLPAAYREYFTHPSAPNLRQRAFNYIKTGYLAGRYGYRTDSVSPMQKAFGCLACLAPFRRAALDVLVRHLSALPRGRLLDVGCGNGQIVEFMDGLGWQAEGVDLDAAAIAVASSKGLRVHAGTLQSQGYAENTFDALVMSHTIEHVPEPGTLLAECRRILRPGGRLIILTPNLASWGHHRFGRAWFALDPPRHLHLFTPRALRGLVVHSGLVVQSATTSLRNLGTIVLGSCAIQETDRFERRRRQPTLRRLRAMALQLWAWKSYRHRPETGEEIDLVAEKPAV